MSKGMEQKKVANVGTSKKMVGDEGVLSVVARIMHDKRYCEIMDENFRLRAETNMLKKKLAMIERIINEKCGPSQELVWYADASGENDGDIEKMENIEQRHP